MKVHGRLPGVKTGPKLPIVVGSGAYHNPPPSTARGRRRPEIKAARRAAARRAGAMT